MPVYSAFTIPTLGMMAQSHSLATIGNNIANVTTGGFKRTDTNFSTVLSRTIGSQSDIGGTRPKDLNQITQQGNLITSSRDLDLAINGQGFFIFNSSVTGSGKTYYGRDGSFEMATVNDITVPGIGGDSITVKDGYLVDKNGYFLQGWTADPTTGLFGNTMLSALRIDPYAFATVGQATSTAALKLNLPANDSAGLPQVTEITLSGTVDTGDVYSVTVDGTTVTYTVQATDTTLNDIRDGLYAAVNADATLSAIVTAAASPTDNRILVTGNSQGSEHTITSSVTVDGGTVDALALPSTVQAAKAGDTQYYNIEVFDNNGIARSVRLDFAKTDTNTWSLSSTVGETPVAQVDTVTLSGTIEAGDIYTVVVEGNSFTHTVTAGDTLTTIRDTLLNGINTATNIAVTATASGADAMTLTADVAGTSFTATASSTNRTPTAQVDNVTLSGSYAAGDTVSVDIDGIGAVVYTVVDNDLTVDGVGGAAVAGNSTAAYDNIAVKVAAAINGDAPTAAVVAAAATGGGGGVVTLTATSAGTAFTQTTAAVATATGVATASTATANVAPTAQIDNATLAGDYAAGDTISVDIDGIGAVIYTITANDLTANGDGTGGVVAGNSAAAYNNITGNLVNAINGDAPTAAVITAAASGGGVVTLTADSAGTAFTQVTSATTAGSGTATASTPTPNDAGVAQIDNLTLTSNYAAGDVVTFNVNGIGDVTYTVVANDLTANGDGTGGVVAGNSAAAYNNITTNIAATIIADAPSAAVVTAAATGGGSGIVTLTATATGTAFSQVSSAARGADSTAAASTATANVAALSDDAATLVNTTANVPATNTTTTAITDLTFNSDGSLALPADGAVTLNLTFPAVGSVAAGTATVALDISEFTQYAGSFLPYSYTNNGFETANTQSIKFDNQGNVVASFDNSTFRTVYRIPLAQFSNPNALQEFSGNVYQETEQSGGARVVDAGSTGYASFLPNTHELSNVDLAGEFTRMMMTQTAYNSSATVFKTVDEMVTTARDLKR